MGKLILKLMGGLLLLTMAAAGILYFTDNRYSLAVKSYNRLKNASSLELSFESRMGAGDNTLGISGETLMLTSPRESYTEVSLDLAALGSPKIMDVYTLGEEVYHRYNLSFLPWQKGMPIFQEDAFNPATMGSLDSDVKMLDLLKFAYILDKGRDEEQVEYYTTDYFTIDEIKGMMVSLLDLAPSVVDGWNILSYEIRVTFDKGEDQLKILSFTFDQEVSGVTLNNGFTLNIDALNSISDIEAPENLPVE
jgi:hypothetical protein